MSDILRSDLHSHTNWVDGRDSPEDMVLGAVAAGLEEFGISEHVALPAPNPVWEVFPLGLRPDRAKAHADAVAALAVKYAGRIRVRRGYEADYVREASFPDRGLYEPLAPDYLIGSVHFLRAPDGTIASVGTGKSAMAAFDAALRELWGGSPERLARAYFAAEREMVSRFDFDVVAHPDLILHHNRDRVVFDTAAPWWREELEATADAIAASGKAVEINTGGLFRGLVPDAYPAKPFRDLLRARGVKFVLSSDAHRSDAIAHAFGRFAGELR